MYYDEYLEKAILYYLIFDNEDYVLDEDDFVVKENKAIIKAINQLRAEKKEITMFSVRDKIKGDSSKVLKYISSLVEFTYATTPEEAYSRVIKFSKKRKLYELLQKNIKEIEETEDIDILAEKTIKDINKISEVNEKEKTFLEQVVETTQEIEKKINEKDDYSLHTGMLDLDDLLCGLHNEESTVIGARPGVGKTTFALQIAERIAENGVFVGIISLEMSDNQLIQKMIAKKTRINSYKMRAGTLSEEELSKIGQASVEISSLPIYLTTKARTIQQIEATARRLKNKNNLGLLVIDYIQLIKNKGKFNSREQEVADITRTLKLLSLELKIPIIGLCQLNRNATRQEPLLSDLRESGAIEQDADNVIFLYQENDSEESTVDITVKVAKQRAGGLGKVHMRFNKPNSEFRNVYRM